MDNLIGIMYFKNHRGWIPAISGSWFPIYSGDTGPYFTYYKRRPDGEIREQQYASDYLTVLMSDKCDRAVYIPF